MRALIALPILAAACSSQSAPSTATTATTQEAVGTRFGNFTCEDTQPGVWDNAFLPQQIGHFTIDFSLANTDPAGGAVDAVAGLSNGPAAAFTDLGPIVRLAPDGFVDARNGGAYQRDAALEYMVYPYDRLVWIHMDVDVPNHTYSVWAHHDGADDTVQIANNYAFRTEQAGLAHIDTIGRYIDSSNGLLDVCDPRINPPVLTTATNHGPWVDTAFPAQTGAFTVEADAWEVGPSIDGVIGLAAASPNTFTDLGPIVRFDSGGYIDVRDGDVYRADTYVQYKENAVYRIHFDVDLATHTYSVTLYPGIYNNPIVIATDYHFRTEQQNVTSLASIGQFVDELSDPPPNPIDDHQWFYVSDPTIMY
jgi:hypothetical protein